MKRLLTGILLLTLTSCAGVGASSFKTGEKSFTAGDYDKAVLAYADAVEKNPANGEYRMRLQVGRNRSALLHKKRADKLMDQQQYQLALREYLVASGLDASIETSRDGVHKAKLYLKVKEQVEEAKKMLRDRHFKQARQLVSGSLGLLPEYQPALDLRKKLDRRASTMIDGIELAVASDEPITLNFKAANLPDVFDILTQLSGIHFILDEAIRTKTTTLYLEDATFAQAFELLLRMNKLGKKVLNAKTILVFPDTKDKKKQFADQVIQTFYLSNIDAKKAVNLLRTMLQVRKIYVNEKLNAIVLRDTPEVIHLAQKILEANDRGTSEVVFDLELVEVNHTKGLKLGTKLSNYAVSVGLSDPSFPTTSPTISDNLVVNNLKNLKFLYSIPSATFDLQKQAGDAEILASPKIRVRNKGKAKVHIGSREPVVTTTINGTQTSENVQYVDVGVKLDVEPVIQLDNTIVTKLGLEVSNVSNRDDTKQTTVLTISTTNANTELILKDGEQTIIGGLLRDDITKAKTGIPLLSDIPLLGSLFTSYSKTKTKREILLSITPHIVRSLKLPEGTDASIWSGGADDLRVGRNFGSFAAEYVEGQGKTPPRAVPALKKTIHLAPQPKTGLAPVLKHVVPKTTRQSAPQVTLEGLKKAQGQPSTTARPTMKPPAAPVGASPAKLMKGHNGQGKLGPTPSGLASPTAMVPDVVLPGLKTPNAILRPSIFISGDRLVHIGQNFSVTLSIQDVKNLFSAPLYIRFNPKLVTFIGASEGEFLKQSGQKTIFTSTLMSDSGRVIIGLKQGVGGQGASGGGQLAQLEFKAKAAGKLSIAPERINFRNPAGVRLPIDSRGLVVEVQ